ncbi:hypothetical protein FRC17_007260 [Serendipita sp. 399]|nr:hypothetical protein FRC17_007260 [Serendipita sp. 399]
MTQTTLFTPVQVGDLTLAHRIVLAPLTRFRANEAHVHGDLAVEYYKQRASTPGTLLITEGTFIAAEAGGHRYVPGIWNQDQIDAWRRVSPLIEVTDAVHENKSFVFMQLWALGRQAESDVLRQEGDYPLVSSSNVPIRGKDTPRPLTQEEVERYIGLYARAAENAIAAGFDGVEIHAANELMEGYLIDQFIQDVSNRRTDQYGGSIENRAQFALRITEAVSEAIGQKRTGIRLSPWSDFGDMRQEQPIPTFSYLIEQLRDRYPELAYLHVVEPKIKGDKDTGIDRKQDETNDFARKIWGNRPYIAAGGYQPDTAEETVQRNGGMTAFGRWFISNPDLPSRIRRSAKLEPFDRKTFFKPESPEGYIDYPFADSTPEPEFT